MSRWRHWSNTVDKPGFSSFLKEAGEVNNIIPTQDPKAYAQQQGWEAMPFGYYRDPKTGQVVARSVEGQLMAVNGQEGGGEAAPQDRSTPLDTGNPAVTSGQTPADRARQLGLQSDGRGGYRDSSGNLAARTVNNELVFYDENGGVVSDGGGGMHLALSQPSWVDPTTGLIITPPAQPETPGEMAAVPDPTPAQPPQGYHSFIQKRKIEMYASAKRQEKINQDIMSKEEQVNAAYESHAALGLLKTSFEETIAKAEESGDEYKIAVANILRDIVNDEANTFQSYFDQIPEESHTELADNVKKYGVQKAKRFYFENNLLSQYESLMNSGDYEAAEELAKKDKSEYDFERKIEKMLDDATGVKAAPKGGVKSGYRGNRTFYNFREIPVEELEGIDIFGAADTVMRDYGIKEPNQLYEVDWEVLDEEESALDRKKTALDALTTWRRKVLPDLPDGVVIYNRPNTDQKARMYEMSGFSKPIDAGLDMKVQIGVVVTEDGKKVVKPVDPTGQMNESRHWKIIEIDNKFIDMINEDSHRDDINMVYELLLG